MKIDLTKYIGIYAMLSPFFKKRDCLTGSPVFLLISVNNGCKHRV